jgi:hypothetical protein
VALGARSPVDDPAGGLGRDTHRDADGAAVALGFNRPANILGRAVSMTR